MSGLASQYFSHCTENSFQTDSALPSPCSLWGSQKSWRVPTYPWQWSWYLHTAVTCKDTWRIPAYHPHWPEYPQVGYLHTTYTEQGTCIPLTMSGVPAYHWHWAGYQHTTDTEQGICIPLTQARIPAAMVPAYHWHWARCLQLGYLHTSYTEQGTCIPLSLVRKPEGYLHTLNTGQNTRS